MSAKDLADECKSKGNAAFGKNTKEGYEEAVVEYERAIAHFPEGHVYHANNGAAFLELAKIEWQKSAKVIALAKALSACTRCTELSPSWPKGFVRKAAAEFELVEARQKWEEDKNRVKDKWEKEDDEAEGGDVQPDEILMPFVTGADYAVCEATCRVGLACGEVPTSAQLLLLRARLQSLRDAGHSTDAAADKLIADPAASLGPKAEGNTFFSAKQFEKAVEKYTSALVLDPFNHVFYSNRSACYAELNEGDKALNDADRCVELCPDFAKGYNRRSTALYLVGRYIDAEAAAKVSQWTHLVPPNSTHLVLLCSFSLLPMLLPH
jgi:tetratricopeptide (TPR) repeat protein